MMRSSRASGELSIFLGGAGVAVLLAGPSSPVAGVVASSVILIVAGWSSRQHSRLALGLVVGIAVVGIVVSGVGVIAMPVRDGP